MELLNADPTAYLAIDTLSMPWEPSPAAGVERRRLEVLHEEIERVTTIVRFAPDSYFPAHSHGGGEEYLVLEGAFSDESGDYTPGYYVRNPPGSRHQPFTREGCTILVKLCQFAQDDAMQMAIDTRNAEWSTGPVAERSYLELHAHRGVETRLVRLAANTTFPYHAHPGGEEFLVLEGAFADDRGDYKQGCWGRNPPGSGHAPVTGDEGALLYLKMGYVGRW